VCAGGVLGWLLGSQFKGATEDYARKMTIVTDGQIEELKKTCEKQSDAVIKLLLDSVVDVDLTA
jgi:hypothetical protein